MSRVLHGRICAQLGRCVFRDDWTTSETDFSLQLMHLHPLTLEDIVQQETREKLELFPRLGYYFVVFQAIEPLADERTGAGTVLGVTVYLVVSREWICSVRVSWSVNLTGSDKGSLLVSL